MNQDDILRMALEANFWGAEVTAPPPTKFDDKITIEEYSLGDKVEHFAKLVAAHEREACALLIENCCSYCAERIRERDGTPRKPMQHAVSVDDITKAALKILDAELTKQEPMRHPGYIVGDHWLQAAYTRICTGETEDEVMTDYGWQRESR
jgi:hypothetical protein